MNRESARGFTLIEVLVALAVLAALATFAWRATASLVEGEARLAAEARRWQMLDAVFSRLEADVRAAVPRPVRVPGGREPAWTGGIDASGQASFAFTRAGGGVAFGTGNITIVTAHFVVAVHAVYAFMSRMGKHNTHARGCATRDLNGLFDDLRHFLDITRLRRANPHQAQRKQQQGHIFHQ